MSADAQLPLCLTLSAGNRHDAPIGQRLLAEHAPKVAYLVMDRAYEDDATRRAAAGDGRLPIVPPRSSRRKPWPLDGVKYKRRNEVERMFGRVKEYRRVATRYDKLDVTYFAFVQLAFIAIALRRLSVNTP